MKRETDMVKSRYIQIMLWIVVNCSLVAVSSAEQKQQMSQEQVTAWLSTHQGTQTFRWVSQGESSAQLKITWQVEGDTIHLWEEDSKQSLNGRPSDHYALTHKRFSRTAPYILQQAQWYEQGSGVAKVSQWTRSQTPAQRSVQITTIGEVESLKTREIEQLKRYAVDRWHELSRQSQHDHLVKSIPMESQESLISHVGLFFQPTSDPLKAAMLQPTGDIFYTIKAVEDRLTKIDGKWRLIREQKVVDQRGKASRVMLDQQGRVLTVVISNQDQLITTELSKPLVSQGQLLHVKGRLQPATLQKILEPHRSKINICFNNSQAGPSTTKALRLNLETSGSLVGIAFKGQHRWGAVEHCLAKILKNVRFNLRSSQPILIEYNFP